MKIATTALPRKLPTTFEGLCKLHWPRPIHDKVDLHNTQEVVDQLALQTDLSKDQREYLETLSALIEDYEDSRTPIQTGGLDLVQTLKYLMAGRGMSASDLGRLLGNRSLGSAILRGTRQISKANALLLAKHFRVSSALFLVS